ncbi:glycosyltransferase [Candidatus Kaiserbacteria bacterium]|nr:glycosyltransferase [Candidatus Kaiserbacteria bacterium]
MRKVLIFSLAYFPKHVGGAEVSIKEITDRIPDIEFHMVTLRFDSGLAKEEKIGNVIVHRVGITTKNPSMADLKRFPLNLNKPLFQFLAAGEAFKLHRRHKFDAIWAMMAHSCGVPAAIFKWKHHQVPYLLTLQEGDPTDYIEKKMLPLWPLFSRAFTSADFVQTISAFLGKWARTRHFKGPLEVIPNAVNAAHFGHEYPIEEVAAVAREELHKKSGEVLLVTTSRLVPKNGIDDIIKALQFLPESVRFVVFGTGPEEAMLKELVMRCHLNTRVDFRGQIGHAEMPLILQACDIFIRPSRSEGMGNSFVEAMAAGLPVIATQEGGLSDFLFDQKRNPDKPTTGWAVDKNSPEQIAEAVKDIIADPEKVSRVVATAKKMAFEKYDWDIIARDMREKVFAALFRT